MAVYGLRVNAVEESKESLKSIVETIGDEVKFEDDKWVCNKLKSNPSIENRKVTLYFSKIPIKYKEDIKFFCLMRIKARVSVRTINGNIVWMNKFLEFILQKDKNYKLQDVSQLTLNMYISYLDNNKEYVEPTKYTIIEAIRIFYTVMCGWNGYKQINPVQLNPFNGRKEENFKKYIPPSIIEKMDRIFLIEEIPLEDRVMYWILRCIPSRVSEICAVEIECLKYFNNEYIIFLPTLKQNDKLIQYKFRRIYIKYDGIGKYLIDLIKEQQKVATELNKILGNNLLFNYKVSYFLRNKYKKDGIIEFKRQEILKTFNDSAVNRHLNSIIKIFNICDDSGEIYKLTSHQLRHVGITDRLEQGFTVEQIRDMTGHEGQKDIIDTYNHIPIKTNFNMDIQEKILQKKPNLVNDKLIEKSDFKGRVLDMNDEVMLRLLRNPRSHKIKGGICSDIGVCKYEYNCLDKCEYFLVNYEDLEFFEEQVQQWKSKMEKYKGFRDLYNNAKYNYDLNKQYVEKIIDYKKENKII